MGRFSVVWGRCSVVYRVDFLWDKSMYTHNRFLLYRILHNNAECGALEIPQSILFQVDEDLIDDLGEKKR